MFPLVGMFVDHYGLPVVFGSFGVVLLTGTILTAKLQLG